MAGPCRVPEPVTARSPSLARVTSLAPRPSQGGRALRHPRRWQQPFVFVFSGVKSALGHFAAGSSPPRAATGSRYSQGLAKVAAQGCSPARGPGCPSTERCGRALSPPAAPSLLHPGRRKARLLGKERFACPKSPCPGRWAVPCLCDRSPTAPSLPTLSCPSHAQRQAQQ